MSMMAAIGLGRIVVKIKGREAGKKAVVVELIDNNFVEITGPIDVSGVKRRRVNIRHIEPTEHIISIEKGASDDKVKETLEAAGLIEFMQTPVL